jgi:hypothetical protein
LIVPFCWLLTTDYSDPDTVLEGLEMTDEVRTELLASIARRLTPQPVKIRAGK